MSCEAQNFYPGASGNCTGSGMNCRVGSGYCRRATGAAACVTTAMTCDATAECKAQTGIVTNWATCSTCGDSCIEKKDNATCQNAACTWVGPQCETIPGPTPGFQCSQTTASACTGEDYCTWVSYTITACGAPKTFASCQPCNTTFGFSTELKSAMAKSIGQKCTWTKTGTFTQDTSLQVNALTQNAKCAPLTTTGMMDNAQLNTFASGRGYIATGTDAKCASAPSGAAALVPTLAALGLFFFSA